MNGTRYGFHVDLGSCIGCKACQVACKDKNDLRPGLLWRRVVEVVAGGWRRQGLAWVDDSRNYFVSTACNHCDEPVCVTVCPTLALARREDGVVSIDAERCMGCRYCEWVCPYGAPRFDQETGVMTKCDLCADQLDRGLPPACVAACPMRVLDCDDIEELRRRHGSLDQVYPLPERRHTRPSTVFTPHRDCLPAEAPGAAVGNQEEIE